MEEEMDLDGTEVSLDEANKLDALESKFYRPQTNIKETMTFKSWKLVKARLEKFDFEKNKPIPGEYEEKIILKLVLDSLNGKNTKADGSPLEMAWDIKSRPCRIAWEPYLRSGQIDKMLFEFVQRGEGKNRKYEVVSLGMKPGQTALPK